MARAVVHLHTEASPHATQASDVLGVSRDDAAARRALTQLQGALPAPPPQA
jgi:hypothetical protein